MRIIYVLILLVATFVEPANAINILQGSPEALARQNKLADLERLPRIREKQIRAFQRSELLVPLPNEQGVTIDYRLSTKYRWCRPKTKDFLIDIGSDFYREFGKKIQVNSAIRTVEYQARLIKRNGNAASNKPGPRESSHLTGATIDIAKRGMSPEQLVWMRDRLANLERRGLIEATEEFQQPVFHIMVSMKYQNIY